MKKLLVILLISVLHVNAKAQLFNNQIFKITSSIIDIGKKNSILNGLEGCYIVMRDSETIVYGKTFHYTYTFLTSPEFIRKEKLVAIRWRAYDENKKKCAISISYNNGLSIFSVLYNNTR